MTAVFDYVVKLFDSCGRPMPEPVKVLIQRLRPGAVEAIERLQGQISTIIVGASRIRFTFNFDYNQLSQHEASKFDRQVDTQSACLVFDKAETLAQA